MRIYITMGILIIICVVAAFVFTKRAAAPDQAVNTPNKTQTGLRYAALGDSYTIGEGVKEADRWPNQLVKQLRQQNIELNLVTNPSRTGYTTEDLLAKEINSLKQADAQFVTVLIGVNDYFQGVSASEFTTRFNLVLDTVQQTAPQAKILVITIPDYGKTPAGASFGNPQTIATGLQEFNKIIINEATKRNLPVVDVFEISQQSSAEGQLVADGLHPSGAQYTKWLEVITPQAKAILK